MPLPTRLLEQTERIAVEAGIILRRHLGTLNAVEHKGSIDLVTEADRASERYLVEALGAAFPEASILAEEGGEVRRQGSYTWVVDPLDGTTNFAHGYPVFAVSIALLQGEHPVLGVVHDPMRQESFTAAAGKGAYLGDRRLQVSDVTRLTEALVVTGFPYDVRTNPRNNLPQFSAFLQRARGVRRDGSAALNLAYLAAGRFDGFWEEGLSPWDVAAGTLLVREAGGQVTGYGGSPADPWDGHIVAAPAGLLPEMLETLREVERGSGLPSVYTRERGR